jgi:hypothetical protein
MFMSEEKQVERSEIPLVFRGVCLSWSSFVLWFLVLGILGFAFVFHIGSVSILIGSVRDDLSAAVREFDAVRAGSHFGVTALRMDEISIRVLIRK